MMKKINCLLDGIINDCNYSEINRELCCNNCDKIINDKSLLKTCKSCFCTLCLICIYNKNIRCNCYRECSHCDDLIYKYSKINKYCKKCKYYLCNTCKYICICNLYD